MWHGKGYGMVRAIQDQKLPRIHEQECIPKPDLLTDTEFGIRIRIFTADTDGYPQAF